MAHADQLGRVNWSQEESERELRRQCEIYRARESNTTDKQRGERVIISGGSSAM